jgi:hypothetical protein
LPVLTNKENLLIRRLYSRKTLFIISFFISFSIYPQDIDSLFEDVSEAENIEEVEQEVNILQDLVNKEGFSLGASFSAYIGYSPGWNLDSDPFFEDSGLVGLSSKIILDSQISDHFRFYQSYSISYPDFEAEVSEFFADYDLNNKVYFRIGRQNLTWGISRYYTFTNLPARLPDDFSSDDDAEDSFSVKLDVPVGIGGLQGLIYTREGFLEDTDYPALDEMGWGGYYNLALKQFDLTAGAYYHNELNTRAFASVSTTLLNTLELYSEFLVSYDIQNDDDEDIPDRLDLGANIGFFVELFSGKLELTGEYYYNGEETELEPVGAKLDLPLVWGHNLALGFSLDIIEKKLNFESYALYNISENTGVLIPVLTLNPGYSLVLKMASPLVFGSDTGTYQDYNPDDFDRDLSFVFTAKISGKI